MKCTCPAYTESLEGATSGSGPRHLAPSPSMMKRPLQWTCSFLLFSVPDSMDSLDSSLRGRVVSAAALGDVLLHGCHVSLSGQMRRRSRVVGGYVVNENWLVSASVACNRTASSYTITPKYSALPPTIRSSCGHCTKNLSTILDSNLPLRLNFLTRAQLST